MLQVRAGQIAAPRAPVTSGQLPVETEALTKYMEGEAEEPQKETILPITKELQAWWARLPEAGSDGAPLEGVLASAVPAHPPAVVAAPLLVVT